MALTDEQRQKIKAWAKQRLRDGKAPLTERGRIAMLKNRKPANKLPV